MSGRRDRSRATSADSRVLAGAIYSRTQHKYCCSRILRDLDDLLKKLRVLIRHNEDNLGNFSAATMPEWNPEVLDARVMNIPDEDQASALEYLLKQELSRQNWDYLSYLKEICEDIYRQLFEKVETAFGGYREVYFNIEQCTTNSHSYSIAVARRDHNVFQASLGLKANVRDVTIGIQRCADHIAQAVKDAETQYDDLRKTINGIDIVWKPLSAESLVVAQRTWHNLWKQMQMSSKDAIAYRISCNNFLRVSIQCFCTREINLMEELRIHDFKLPEVLALSHT